MLHKGTVKEVNNVKKKMASSTPTTQAESNRNKWLTLMDSEKIYLSKRLSLLDLAEVYLLLPEAGKREVLGYAKCLYASSCTHLPAAPRAAGRDLTAPASRQGRG